MKRNNQMYGLLLRIRFVLMLVSLLISSCNLMKPASEVVVLPKDQRPNILFVMLDDLDAEMNSISYMKNLQNLMVARGTSLDDFLITTPTRTFFKIA